MGSNPVTPMQGKSENDVKRRFRIFFCTFGDAEGSDFRIPPRKLLESNRECKYLDSDLRRIQSAGDPQDWTAEKDTAGADDKLPPIGWQRTEMTNAIIFQTGKKAASKRIRINMMAETIRKSRKAIPMQRIRRLLCRQRGIRLCTCR